MRDFGYTFVLLQDMRNFGYAFVLLLRNSGFKKIHRIKPAVVALLAVARYSRLVIRMGKSPLKAIEPSKCLPFGTLISDESAKEPQAADQASRKVWVESVTPLRLAPKFRTL
ncbi:hypothetical protein M0R45_005295 [Rubus argutus]|uniref:Uncharacterized protein n=1 Tax=Rubus argutus TaxID=59490 RepID=A0AAW1YMC3_RUBAR